MKLPTAQKYVLLALADHADHEGYGVRPSYDLIAWKTGYTKRHVMTIVAKLEAAGILVLDKQGGTACNPYECNTWHIDVKAAPQTPSRKVKGGVITRSPGGGDHQITRSVIHIEPNTISTGVPVEIPAAPPQSQQEAAIQTPPVLTTPTQTKEKKSRKPRTPKSDAPKSPVNPDRSKIYNTIAMLYYGIDPLKNKEGFKPFAAMTNKLTGMFLRAYPGFTYDEFIDCSKTFPPGYRDFLKADSNIGELVGKWLAEKRRKAAIAAKSTMIIKTRNPLTGQITHYRNDTPVFVEVDGRVIPCDERGNPVKETSI